jgi:serine/threonine-protein kinase
MTEAGLIMGTAAYMSPEQARGKTVDKRADIWSFGVVLFETLTGARAFKGETVSDTLAAVLTAEPDWKRLPAGSPPSVERLIRRCLDRDVKHRLQAIGEARIVLTEGPKDDAAGLHTGERVPWAGRLAPWAIALLSLAAVGWMLQRPASHTAGLPTHIDLAFPAEIEPLTSLDAGFAISPDGRAVMLTGATAGARRVFIRQLGRDETLEVSDPTGINGSAFSPDSQSIVYGGAAGSVVTFNLADRQRKVIGNSADGFGSLPWGHPGIVFSRKGELWLAPVSGGAERQLTKLDQARQETLHANPTFLPDGRVLFVSLTVEAGDERIEAVSVEDGKRSVVLERANTPLYSPTGHLLF